MASSYQYIDATGIIVADTETLLTQVQSEYTTVFGSEMSTDPSTPQGVLITAETTARKAVVDNNVALANQINPNIAGGVFLDAIGEMTGLKREVATPSTINDVTVTGVAFTIIPSRSQAKTTAGDLFETVTAVVIPLGGTTTVNFQSVELGAIPCAINALTDIVPPSSVLGWETVINSNAAVLGTNEQSDLSLRSLRRNTLALQGVALAEAIISALYIVPGVKSLQFRENDAATTQTIDTISMVAHSIWACVDGGVDDDIATSLLTNKSSGCAYNGATSVAVVEPISGQTYTVKFDRPTPEPIVVKVTAHVPSAITNPTVAIQEAVLAYATGQIDGQTGFTVGTSVSPFEIAGAVVNQINGVYVQKVEVSLKASIVYQTTELVLAINQIATLLQGDITVVLV